MASPYAALGQVLHYPQPHETLPPPIQQDYQTPDFAQDLPLPQPPLPPQQQPPQFPPPGIPPQPFPQPFPGPQPQPYDPNLPPMPMPMPMPQPPMMPPVFPPSYPVPAPCTYQPPLWTPFHLQSLIPPDTPAQDIIPPTELAVIVPLRTDTHIDRDLALLLTKAHKYGGVVPGGHKSRHKYEKYTFLAGLLLAKRGLPAMAIPDDPDDPYVKLLQVYLSNTSRLGSDPDAVLMKTLVKGGRYYERESRRSRSHSRRSGRSGSRKSGRSGSRKSGRSGSRRRSERKSSSRHCSSSSDTEWDD